VKLRAVASSATDFVAPLEATLALYGHRP